MKLKYQINSILRYNLDKKNAYTKENYAIEAIILGNKCICISDLKNIYIFDKNYKLIKKIELDIPYGSPRNMCAIKNYPNLFCLKTQNPKKSCYSIDSIDIYKINLKNTKLKIKKNEVILYKQIYNIPEKYKYFINSLFSLTNIDILIGCENNLLIYNINNNNFKNIELNLPKDEEEKYLGHDNYIIKIIEYNDNELFLLMRELIYDEFDNIDLCYKVYRRDSLFLYDIKKNIFKKKYISNEVKDGWRTNMTFKDEIFFEQYFSNNQNIFIINKSIIYLKDSFRDNCFYSIYIINISNGDIKYKFEVYNYHYNKPEFEYFCNFFRKSIYLCKNIFLFDGHEVQITKKGIIENKIDNLFKEGYYNQHYIKIKDNLFLTYDEQMLKIYEFSNK